MAGQLPDEAVEQIQSTDSRLADGIEDALPLFGVRRSGEPETVKLKHRSSGALRFTFMRSKTQLPVALLSAKT